MRVCIALLVATLAACGRPNAPAAVEPAIPVQTDTAPAAASLLRVKNQCLLTEDKLLFHVAIPVDFTIRGKRTTQRSIWQINCTLGDRTCRGVYVDLEGVDRGEALDMSDLSSLIGAEIVSLTGSVAVIQWGPYRTFTVDLDLGTVRYSESADSTEGRGEASCDSP